MDGDGRGLGSVRCSGVAGPEACMGNHGTMVQKQQKVLGRRTINAKTSSTPRVKKMQKRKLPQVCEWEGAAHTRSVGTTLNCCRFSSRSKPPVKNVFRCGQRTTHAFEDVLKMAEQEFQLQMGCVDMYKIKYAFDEFFEGQFHQVLHLCTGEAWRRRAIFPAMDRILFQSRGLNPIC